MLNSIKEYTNKHKDTLFTLLLVLILDHFVFNGAMRSKIQSVLEGMVRRIEDCSETLKEKIQEKTHEQKS